MVVRQIDRYVILDDWLPLEQFALIVEDGLGGVWHRVNVVKRNAPFARAAITGFLLGANDDRSFWRWSTRYRRC